MSFLSAKTTFILCITGCIILIFQAFNYSKSNALEQITNDYKNDLKQLETSLAQLKNTVHKQYTVEELQNAFLTVRADYKTIEFLLEYSDAQAVKDCINGAPLPKIERNSPGMKIMEPHGLQVIEELLFADEINNEALKSEIDLLVKNYDRIKQFQEKNKLTERNLFEAARLQLVRVVTMGITGFDTPGSGNSLTDSKNSLKPVLKMASAYQNQPLMRVLESAINYLEKNNDFDAFNRMEFIREYINPAYKLFKDLQLQSGVETIYETADGDKQPFNYLADNIFSPDFLNPAYFSISADKTINPDKATLGKYLFFDPLLSTNNKRACASCHNPAKAFTDGQERSTAMDFEGSVARNSPTLINSIFADRYFYDMRVEKIENQFEHVITSPQEFNSSYPEIIAKLEQSDEYKKLFTEAYPELNGEISKHTIAESIGAYIKTLIAFNSDFDKHIRREANTLNPQAVNGFNLFMGKAACATCHFAPTFSGLVPPYFSESESEVLGIPASPDTLNAMLDEDIGRFGGRMKEKADFNRNAFKTVTVRNIALTAPYMHNGIYKTLDEVLDFYNRGGGEGLGIHLENQTLAPDILNLTPAETKDIISFMQSLTDTAGLTEVPVSLPRFDTQPEWNKRAVGGEY